MISINKNCKEIPDSLSNDKFKKHFARFIKNEVKASNNYYAADDVKNKLKKLYNNKCAYCETIEHKPEIDHYRPKSKYPLLTYEWSNLLPTCHNCNHCKFNNFPVKIKIEFNGKIADASELNKLEQPFIINPEIDSLEKLFLFNVLTGEIKAKNNNIKSVKTIEICDLNSDTLIYKRQKIYKELVSIAKLLNLVFLKNSEGYSEIIRKFVSKLKNGTKKMNEYSSLQKQIWNEFEKIILPLFKTNKQKEVVEKNYRKLITNS